MLLDSQTPPCAAWSLAQSTPVAFPHCVLVWKRTQQTWCAAELCSFWWPSLRLRLGFEITDCDKDGTFPAQSADQGEPCTANMFPTLMLWKRLPRAQKLSDLWANAFQEPSAFVSILLTVCTVSFTDPSAVLLTLKRRLWYSLIMLAVNWFTHCTSRAEQQTCMQLLVRLQLNNTI